MFRYTSKETSHTLDGNPRGVHVNKDAFDTGADDSGSRVMRVTDVRKNSIADACTRTARFR